MEEVREGLVGEIEEIIGWLGDRASCGEFRDPGLDIREGHYMHVLAR